MPRDERAPSVGVSVTDALASGDAEVLGLLPFSSNYVFLLEVTHGDGRFHAVYKPSRGERPLWDFPHGSLAGREVAAFLVSEASGFDLVPPTVFREDLPHGPGSVQLFIDHDPQRHFFVLVHEREPDMATLAAFDVAINNADRKAGHVIEDDDGHLWGVDHGLSFNVEPKLRTVNWTFAGQPLPDPIASRLRDLVAALDRDLGPQLEPYLSPEEITETRARVEVLLLENRFPEPQGPFHMPWPLI